MEDPIVKTATFSTAIKRYIFIVPCFFMLISIAGIPLMIIWLLGPGMIFARRYFDSLSCTLTRSKLKYSKGVFVRVEKTIPLENIQDLTFVEGPILKAFHLSMLKIETAGHGGSTRSDMRLIGVEEAQEFRNTVLSQRDAMKSPPQIDTGNSDRMLEVLEEIRDLLKEGR